MQGEGGFYRAMLSLLVRAPISVLWISLTLSIGWSICKSKCSNRSAQGISDDIWVDSLKVLGELVTRYCRAFHVM